jgi:hypothetical protein
VDQRWRVNLNDFGWSARGFMGLGRSACGRQPSIQSGAKGAPELEGLVAMRTYQGCLQVFFRFSDRIDGFGDFPGGVFCGGQMGRLTEQSADVVE